MHVRYSPLPEQYADPEEIFDELRALVKTGDFTLGKVVSEFEADFAAMLGVKHAIGVGSGTDALKIPLKALEPEPGDEVITTANTFWATVGAICETGAKPVFIDCDDSFCMDVNQLASAITPRTKAIMPVHLTGDISDMASITEIADRHGVPVIEDACQSLYAEVDGQYAGSFGVAGAFSMHPLKIINVWGDAGVIVTNDDELNRKYRLLRNHGLRNRDEMEILGYNSRLDSVQAVVGKWILRQLPDIVNKRAQNAAYYDAGLDGIPGIRLPARNPGVKHVYLFYPFLAERREELYRHCIDAGIEAKIHYPLPLYLQDALRFLGHKAGDFPVTDRHANSIISLPVDQHMTREAMDFVIDTIKSFYGGN